MKKLSAVLKSVVACAFIFSLTSCTSLQIASPQTAVFSPIVPETSPRFHDDGAVNAVLQFSSWEYTFLVRPQYADHGFLEQVRPDNIGQVFDQLNVPRGTAAVVVGWTYNGQVLDKLVADWKAILGRCGFQRVVVLRAQEGNRLNGSVVIDDSILHVSSVQSASQGG